VFKKEDKKDQEARGSVALSNTAYAINTWARPFLRVYFLVSLHRGFYSLQPASRRRCPRFSKKQANDEIRCIIFTGLFEQTLLSKLFYHI